MLSPPLTPVHPHPSPPAVNLHAPVTDLYKYLATSNRAGKRLRGKTVGGCLKRDAKTGGREGGVGGTIRERESGSTTEEESKSMIERDGDRKERLG